MSRRLSQRLARARSPLAAASACALAIGTPLLAGGCADTLGDQPVPHNVLEGFMTNPTPVYWLGRSFARLQITDATHDPGGAFTLQYGDCLQGGQSACVAPLKVVTNPDNSFLPGGAATLASGRIRGVEAAIARAGKTIELATGSVVVDIYARDARLAASAAQALAPINRPEAPTAPLPPPAPDSGFARKPLPSQVPSPVRALGSASTCSRAATTISAHAAGAPRSSCASPRTYGRRRR